MPALLLTGALIAPVRADVTFELLGTLPEHERSRGHAINASGQTAGRSWSRTTGVHRAFRFTGVMEDLGVLPDLVASVALGINDRGQVAGYSYDEGLGRSRAYRHTDGVGMEDLGTLGGLKAWAHAVNDAGQVTGYSTTDGSTGQIAFRFTDGVEMENLGVLPGGDDSVGQDLNDHGQVVGYSGGGSILDLAFRYTDGVGMESLGTLPGDNRSYALGINNRAQVVGYSFPNELNNASPFVFTDGIGMERLLKLAEARPAEAHAINDDGWIVGWSQGDDLSTRAVLWRPDHCIVDLNELVQGQLGGNDVHLERAFDISNARQITGVAIVDDKDMAFRITFGDCPGDVDGSGAVEFDDLLAILAAWGPCVCGCPEDLDGSGVVDFGDALIVLGDWGPCPAFRGACCLPGGDCVEMVTLETCQTLGGSYLGGRTSCTECRFGACCFEDYTCTERVTDESCGVMGGTYLGDGTDCFECSLAADDCADAATVGDGTYLYSTRDTTSEGPDLPAECDEGRGLLFRHDVWFRYHAACDGVATATVCDSGFDTRLAVYESSNVECPGPFLACADDTCGEGGTRSEVSFTVQSGGTYLIRIGARFAVGDGALVLDCAQ